MRVVAYTSLSALNTALAAAAAAEQLVGAVAVVFDPISNTTTFYATLQDIPA